MNPDDKQLLAVTQREIEKLRRDHNDLRSLILTRKRSPKKWRSVGGGGGSSTSNLTSYGVVVVEAPPCTVQGEGTSLYKRTPAMPSTGKYLEVKWDESNKWLYAEPVVPPLTPPSFYNFSEHYTIKEHCFIEVQELEFVNEGVTGKIRIGRPFGPVDAFLQIDNEYGQAPSRDTMLGNRDTMVFRDLISDVSYDTDTGELHRVKNAAFEQWGQAEPCP